MFVDASSVGEYIDRLKRCGYSHTKAKEICDGFCHRSDITGLDVYVRFIEKTWRVDYGLS